MGCSFVYEGKLANHALQRKVVDLVRDCYDESYVIQPEPGVVCRAKFGDRVCEYPFEFFGVVPDWTGPARFSRGQFLFDRAHGDRLVSLSLVEDVGMHAETLASGPDLHRVFEVEEGGYTRLGGSRYDFALILYLLRIR